MALEEIAMSISFRMHQIRAQQIGQEIRMGNRNQKLVLAYVTPGGGKTLMASIFAHELLGSDVEQVLVICPRKALQTQMRDGFHAPAIGLRGELTVGNYPSPRLIGARHVGRVTTYQDVIANPGRWKRFVEKRTTLLVLDEGHHLRALDAKGDEDKDTAGWSTAVAPLVEKAKRVLMMTGTLVRDDNARIEFIRYDENPPGTFNQVVDIRYTRRDGIDEKAVLNVYPKVCDGVSNYWHLYKDHCHNLRTVKPGEESRALNTILGDENYRHKILSLAIGELAEYRSRTNPGARMIVVCANQSQARKVAKYISDAGSYRAVLAISDEPNAHGRLAKFRDRGEGEILVTCQMAHEGLDVPDCTHLVALTNFRARSWLEQALSRVTRFDSRCGLPFDKQCAYLYVPSDPSMATFLSKWIDDQDPAWKPSDEGNGKKPKPHGRSTFIPKSGEFTEVLHGDNNGILSDDDQRRINLLNHVYPEQKVLPIISQLNAARKIWPDVSNIPDIGMGR